MIKIKRAFQKAKHLYLPVVIFLSASLVSVSLFWSLFPYNIATVNNHPEVLNVPAPGGVALVQFDNCSDYEGRTTVTRQIFNEAGGVTLNQLFFNNSAGCRTQPIPISVPTEVPPGVWQIRIDTCAQVNPIRTVCFEQVTNKFLIKSKKQLN